MAVTDPDTIATPLPGPRELPLLGNIADINNFEVPLWSFHELAEKYGEVYQLRFPGYNPGLFVSSVALTNELCDEKRFRKKIGALLGHMRKGLGDGMFTVNTDDEGWGVAHRILMPAFGPVSIRSMFDEMKDIAAQMTLKWARQGGGTPINVTDDFTRLSLDTLALCGMGFRFNGFYQPEMHPFVESMQRFMNEADKMCRRLPVPGVFYRDRDRQFRHDIDVMRGTADEVVRARRANATAVGDTKRTDLLEAMLEGVDPKTGRMLSDGLIVDNLVGFLAAGHETTSSMLSFAFYELLRHPAAMRRARAEVDAVCGAGAIAVDHLGRLEYVGAVLRESLRLNPTIPGFMVEAVEDTTIGTGDKKYPVKQWQTVTCLLGAVHLDRAVYGEDRLEFKPERMMDEPFKQREEKFGNCWKPFGNGLRGCIGRPFAWQESLLICAMLLQNFEFEMADPDYELKIKQNTTLKPKDFYMKATLRQGLTPTTLEKRLFSGPHTVSASGQGGGGGGVVGGRSSGHDNVNGTSFSSAAAVDGTGSGTALSSQSQPAKQSLVILYGSESGTCQSLAHQLAADARSHGAPEAHVDCLDSAAGRLTEYAINGQPVVIITPSYEGQPPDNAKAFVSWIEALAAEPGQAGDTETDRKKPLSGLKCAVYGCGNRDWANTFQRIPRLVDDTLGQLGAQRIAPLGQADMADGGDVVAEFQSWADKQLWPALGLGLGLGPHGAAGSGSGLGASEPAPAQEPTGGNSGGSPALQGGTPLAVSRCSTAWASNLRYQGLQQAEVTEARLLTAPGHSPAKRHIEVRLPAGTSYRPGDHLAVLPKNPRETVLRAMRRLALVPSGAHSAVPETGPPDIDSPPHANEGDGASAYQTLSEYVELGQAATKRNINTLITFCNDESTKDALSRLVEEDIYPREVTATRTSVLDLLELFPAVQLDLGAFLGMLPPLRTRLYSISSAPPDRINSRSPSDPAPAGVIASLSYSVLGADEEQPARGEAAGPPPPAPAGDAAAPSPRRSSSSSSAPTRPQGRRPRRGPGAATSHMAGLRPGDALLVAVRQAHSAFRLQEAGSGPRRPLICVAAGVGIAPFRGFVQDRAAAVVGTALHPQQQQQQPMLLFFGCRGPGLDDLYRGELDGWEKAGAVEVYRAYSRGAGRAAEEARGCRWAQERLAREEDRVWELWRQGAVVYVCGSKGLSEGVGRFMVGMKMRREGADQDEAAKWLRGLVGERYVEDIFS